MSSSKVLDAKVTAKKDRMGKMLRDAGRQQPASRKADPKMGETRTFSSGEKEKKKKGKKRPRKEDSTLPQDSSQDNLPPAKKIKTTNPVIPFEEPAIPAETDHASINNLPPQKDQSESNSLIAPDLQIQLAAYRVVDINIISSSKIHRKVTQILEAVERFSFVTALKPTIVLLHAKGPVVSKMITIVEIAKREIDKQAKWFQYNGLDQLMAKNDGKDTFSTANGAGRRLGLSTEMEVDQDGGDGDGDDASGAFETMKTAWERALEGKPKVKAVPIMMTFLSRIRVPILKEKYGEQTNALT